MKTVYSTSVSEWLQRRIGHNIKFSSVTDSHYLQGKLLAYNDDSIIVENEGIESLIFRHSIHCIVEVKSDAFPK